MMRFDHELHRCVGLHRLLPCTLLVVMPCPAPELRMLLLCILRDLAAASTHQHGCQHHLEVTLSTAAEEPAAPTRIAPQGSRDGIQDPFFFFSRSEERKLEKREGSTHGSEHWTSWEGRNATVRPQH